MRRFPEAVGLGTLLRHLVELLDGDVEAIYASEALDCRSRFTPVIRHIEEHGASSIKSVAGSTGLSHSAISQTISEMLKRELVVSLPGEDGRERIISFSPKGEALLPRLHVVWNSIGAAASELCDLAGHDLVTVLKDTISAAEETPFRDLIQKQIDRAPSKPKTRTRKRKVSA